MYNNEELELVGALIGDGHIHKKNSKYYFGFTGHKVTDKQYFSKLSDLIENVWGKKARVFESSGGLRIRIYSKKIVNRLIQKFSMPYNFGKDKIVRIPKDLLNDFKKCKHVLRGIADTDGSVFVSDKKGTLNYPALEITTISKGLVIQIRMVLLFNGFRVTNLRAHKSKHSKNTAYKVCLYGKENLKKWIREIGFSNPIKLKKALSAI